MHDYDKSSKWLIQHHGDSILRLGGIHGVVSWRPLQSEIVQPRKLPDGLLEVSFENHLDPSLYVIEMYTYPDRRSVVEIANDVLFVYLDRKVLPEVLTIVLHPRGNVSLAGPLEVVSKRGGTKLSVNWQVVELWKMSAALLLEANDVGLIPWVPLTQFEGPPESLLEECRQRIETQAPTEERANLLAVCQVLTRLRYNDEGLLSIWGGKKSMIESPLIQELWAERSHTMILAVLERRFGSVPPELSQQLRRIQSEEGLRDLNVHAAVCSDLNSFHKVLESIEATPAPE